MATRMQQRRGTAAQWISTNAGAGPVLNAGEIGWESDTNKFKIGDGVNNWSSLDYFADINSTANPAFGTSITFEGATADSYETVLQVTDPTADRTITLPNVTGTVITTGNLSDITDIGVFSSTITMEGSTADAYELTISAGDPTADRTITFPDATGTVALTSNIPAGIVTTSDSGTVTSTMIANGTIADADINASAAIALSKLATDPLARANHTGSQTASTISDFNEAAQDAVGGILGSGLTYTDASNTITVDSSVVQLRVANITDTEIGYLDGVTSAIQTQLNDKAPLASPTFTGTVSAAALTLSGDLTVNGTTTTINSTTLAVDDKNIVLGDVAIPTDTTADGGGITLKGATDKTFNWVDATDAWTSSEHINLASGKSYSINGTALKDVSETLTNKSISFGSNTVTSTLAQLNTAVSDADVASLAGSETLTNKTVALGSNTVSGTLAQFNTAVTDADFASLAGTETFTNKSISMTTNTITGTFAEFNIAVTDHDLVSLTSTSTMTNKTLTSPIITGLTLNDSSIIFEGATADAFETTLTVTDPTADRTLTLPDATGTLLSTALFSAKGTLLVGTGTGTFTTQSVGTNGQVLSANSAQSDGVEWVTPAGGSAFSEFMLIGA